MDFLRISPRTTKRGTVEVAPKFILKNSEDLMIRGGDFYAIWDERKGLWSQNQDDVVDIIDAELKRYVDEHYSNTDDTVHVAWMWDSDSGSLDRWHKYVQKQMTDHYHPLNETLVFANSPTRKEDYASKKLPYALEDGDISAWDELVGTLYSPAERHKIEWAIGSVVSGDSKENQKFLVFYGEGGSGKSTILKIIKQLFDGYDATFDAKSLGSGSDSFALEAFKSNPLVAIQYDGNLSRIEDNTKLNSLIAHEELVVNEKFAKRYSSSFKAMLFLGTNYPVKISDTRSGIIRRLIDVSPTGKLIPRKRYDALNKQVKFELGAIAKHCLDIYEADKTYYDTYLPKTMIGASNDFFNYMEELFDEFYKEDGTTLDYAWDKYNVYCTNAKVPYPYTKRIFKEELKGYFKKFDDRVTLENGQRVRSYYSGLRLDKFGFAEKKNTTEDEAPAQTEEVNNIDIPSWLNLRPYSEFSSNPFNDEFKDCPAQYGVGVKSEKPSKVWDEVTTKLKDIDQTKCHYVMTPPVYIHIDFDKKDKDGKKCLEENLKAASEWKPTYAEVSKGGQGLHLTYRYTGDISKISRIYDDDIEIKVSVGKSSLRRKLSFCNDIPIATISSGLPLKEVKKVIDLEAVKGEKELRAFVKSCLRKKHHGYTAPEVDYIYSELEKAYNSGVHYDISDMRDAVIAFANNSSHQAQKCLRKVSKMHFKSEEPSDDIQASDESPLVFFDFEVYPNVNFVCYAFDGEEPVGITMPTADDILMLSKYRLVGHNCRRYDNHIAYGILHGYTAKQIYALSDNLINKGFSGFQEALNFSYLDTWDASSANNRMSLKKWEIKLHCHHQEMGWPWNKDLPEDKWNECLDYCKNDVRATMKVYHSDIFQADFKAREILADIAGGTVNDTTNKLTTKIILGDAVNPQKDFVYTDLSTIFPGYEFSLTGIDNKAIQEGRIKPGETLYSGKVVNGKSIYKGIDPSEGGRVYAEPGIYYLIALLDIASMHPSSIEALNLFGPYTKNFSDLKRARVYIKHKEYDKAKELFGGKLSKYLDDPKQAKALSNALKTAINSVYGLTSAGFENKLRDPRNIDNIVAKRGALFMIELQLQLQSKGYQVAHVKTDSIKIPEADQEVIDFVMNFGQKYGYTFEHEATYERMCLVNESVYVAKYNDGPHEFELPTGQKIMTPWTATGTQFQVPYVFKKLFCPDEPIIFDDLCETKSVTSALYLDFNERLPEGQHDYRFVGKVGLFCPMKEGVNAGILLREKDGKFNSATGAKGYRWMEAEMVTNLGLEDQIDRGYYDRMVNEAIETIEKFGDAEMFLHGDPVSEVPF